MCVFISESCLGYQVCIHLHSVNALKKGIHRENKSDVTFSWLRWFNKKEDILLDGTIFFFFFCVHYAFLSVLLQYVDTTCLTCCIESAVESSLNRTALVYHQCVMLTPAQLVLTRVDECCFFVCNEYTNSRLGCYTPYSFSETGGRRMINCFV